MDTPKIKLEGIFTLRELYAGFALAGLATSSDISQERAALLAERYANELVARLEGKPEASQDQEVMQFMRGREA